VSYPRLRFRNISAQVRPNRRTKTGTLENGDFRKRAKPRKMAVSEGLELVGGASEISNLLNYIAH
jgi:hypothetical protein